ncbi:MAG: 16S rRNA (cytosine(967)-C(5))-methyltransferase RsmB [Lachnospiraceae bacterium]|nr:16S rRNA (cytosine(967)-C(5))-methyltransferase RsmB [Lachnospiraceae bacterium]
MAKVSESRKLALEILLEQEKSAEKAGELLRAVMDKHAWLPQRDRAFLKRLVNGCIERRITLDHVIDCHAKTKTAKMKPVLRMILRLGTYQLLYMDSVPASAAVNESVNLARSKGLSGLSSFANGVLRAIASGKDAVTWPDPERDALHYLSVRYSMPEWIVKRLCDQYGRERCESILNAFLAERPLSVRFCGKDKDALAASWREQGIIVKENPWFADAFYLENVPGVERLQGFAEGEFVVQDSSSMLAVSCAGICPGDTVVDLCASPGGKSMLAASVAGPDGRVLSFDLTEAKVEKLRENAKRTSCGNLTAAVRDAREEAGALKESADVLIADLPCSGLGVAGRKPDIRYRLKEEDIESLRSLQRSILDASLPILKPGGTLLYSTCTILADENEENREWLLKEHGLRPIDISGRLPAFPAAESTKEGMLQLLPGEPAGYPVLDGFFFACFRREA